MNDLENSNIKHWDLSYTACGKSADYGGGLADIKVEERMIVVCCPLCAETFNKNPRHYLELRKAREIGMQLRQPKG